MPAKSKAKPHKTEAAAQAAAQAKAEAEAEANEAVARALAEAELEAAAALAAAAEAAAARRHTPIDERGVEETELLEFLFPTQPKRLFHPASAARLFLFARHGPLVGGHIMGGRVGWRRALTPSELELMLDQVVREDLLAAFVGDRALSLAEEEEVLREARSLRSRLYDYTQAEIKAFLAELRVVSGLEQGAPIPFRILQRAIELERTRRGKTLRTTQPRLVTSSKPPKAASGGGLASVTALQRTAHFAHIRTPAPAERARMPGAVLVHGLGPSTNLPKFQQEVLGDAFGPVRATFWRADAAGQQSAAAVVVLSSEEASLAALHQLEGRLYRGRRLHLELPLAPEAELSSFESTEALLSKNAHAIAQLGLSANDPGLRQNAILLRSAYSQRPRPTEHDGRLWDDLHGTRGTLRQSYVDDRSSRHIADFGPKPLTSLTLRKSMALQL